MLVVTGAAGFIGSRLARALARRGLGDLLLVDHAAAFAKRDDLGGAAFSNRLSPEELLERLPRLERIDAILHQGACTSTLERDVDKMMAANFAYSSRLLAIAGSRNVRLIYASSAAVYGRGLAGFREEPACEEALNVYAASKLAFDQRVRSRLDEGGAAAARRAQIVGLRYFNVYGPGEAHKGSMASLVHQLWQKLERGEAAEIFAGSEGFRRDFVFVDDVVEANVFVLAHPEVSGIFNCGSGTAHSFAEVARLVIARRGGGELRWRPFPESLRPSYQAYTCADLTCLRAAGFPRAPTSLQDGIARYVSALRAP